MLKNNTRVHADPAAVWLVMAAAALQIAATSLPALGIGEPIGSGKTDRITSSAPSHAGLTTGATPSVTLHSSALAGPGRPFGCVEGSPGWANADVLKRRGSESAMIRMEAFHDLSAGRDALHQRP